MLVLAPTRELAIQIGQSFATYGKHLRLRQTLVYGGVNQASQVRALRRGAHILVATPGRLLDLMNQGHIDLGRLEAFVLDEADRMLDMGFLPDIKRIIGQLPDRRQSLFFSATLPPAIKQLTEQLLNDPLRVNVTPKLPSVKRIEQQVFFVERRNKQALLRRLIKTQDVRRALVFTKTKRGANSLAERLDENGIKATAIHGNKSQAARQRALESFRRNDVQVLVATDVASRGIDIDGISHVVNFDLPVEPESYVHRIGRTGRAGAEGIAVSFCTDSERSELRAIEAFIGERVPAAPGQPAQEREQGKSVRRKPQAERGRRYSAKRSASKKSGSRRSTSGSGRSTATRGGGKSANQPKARRRKRRSRELAKQGA